jgi:predicted nucleic acid-binding Zn finger protein
MLQNKDTHKISELKNAFTHRWVEADFIFGVFKCFNFSKLNKELSFFKSRGFGFDWAMSMLIAMPFLGFKTVSSLSGAIDAGKDVFYRIKNNPSINWRYILWLFAVKFNKTVGQGATGPRCLIFDDTTLMKTGKKIEKASYVWDHVQRRCVLGFKLLVAGLWDGTSFIPLDFSLHREKGTNKKKYFGLSPKHIRKQFKKKRLNGCHGYDRSKEADESKIDAMLKMLKRTVSYGLAIDYVLVDSWFTCNALIEAVSKVKKQTVHLIGMYKIATTKFQYRGKQQTYGQIRNSMGKPKRCRKLGFYYLQARVGCNGRDLQLFFSKQGKNGKWKTILTTDTQISFIETIEIYQIRWTIEVFFKESKQLLALGRCSSNDFDAHIADLTLTMIQFMLLTFRYRFDTYESKGALFEQVKSQTMPHRLSERIWGLFVEFVRIIAQLFDGVDETEVFAKLVRDDRSMENLRSFLQNEHIPPNAA